LSEGIGVARKFSTGGKPTPGANVWRTGPKSGISYGMYRLYDAGGGKRGKVFAEGKRPPE
jgi:hypothetical protein